MKPIVILIVTTLSACSATSPIIYSDPSYNPFTVKHLVLVIEDHSGLGDLQKNPALARATASNVVSALAAKGYDVRSTGDAGTSDHVLLAQIDQVQVTRHHIPHPVSVRKLPVSCEILAGDTKQQLHRVVVDGYRPYGTRTAAAWINDPSKLYRIAIQVACEHALIGTPKGQ